jgi:hypothetical protein
MRLYDLGKKPPYSMLYFDHDADWKGPTILVYNQDGMFSPMGVLAFNEPRLDEYWEWLPER